jgi:hypothetical protein
MPELMSHRHVDVLLYIKLLQDIDDCFNNVDKYNFTKKRNSGYQPLAIEECGPDLNDTNHLSKPYFKKNFLRLHTDIKRTSAALKTGVDANDLRALISEISLFVTTFKRSYPRDNSFHVPAMLCYFRQRSFRLMFQHEVVNYFKKNDPLIKSFLNAQTKEKIYFNPKNKKRKHFCVEQADTSHSENCSLLGNTVKRGQLFTKPKASSTLNGGCSEASPLKFNASLEYV